MTKYELLEGKVLRLRRMALDLFEAGMHELCWMLQDIALEHEAEMGELSFAELEEDIWKI
jgi:hypothetical protein